MLPASQVLLKYRAFKHFDGHSEKCCRVGKNLRDDRSPSFRVVGEFYFNDYEPSVGLDRDDIGRAGRQRHLGTEHNDRRVSG